jgi:thiol-disulfide isomerase/thioredoxin
MKEFLHSMGGVWLDRELSVINCRQSDIDVALPFISRPIPKKQLSTASNQRSEKVSPIQAIPKLMPKAYHLIPFLFLVFVSCGAALAQEPVGHTAPAAKAEKEIVPLKIGDRVPDELWEMYFPVVSANFDEIQYFSLGDFKDKLIILDFWATWCSPCVAMIPKMDSLQKVFGDKIQVLSVTYQKKEEVLPFLAKLEQVKEQKYHLPVFADDDYLRFAFPHTGLPHYVWINSGIVKSITGYEEVNENNIHALIKHDEAHLKEKADEKNIPFDRNKLLFMDGNGGSGEAIRYHSVLAGYTPGLSTEYNLKEDSIKGNKITLTNSPLFDLYTTAYGGRNLKYRSSNRIIFEIIDSSKFSIGIKDNIETGTVENLYSYELKVPVNLNNNLYSIMQRELGSLFPQYEAQVEIRKVACWALIRTSNKDKLKTRSQKVVYKTSGLGANIRKTRLKPFIQDLNLFYLQMSPLTLIDDTGYEGEVDMDIMAKLSDVSSLNKALLKYDLRIIETEREIDMLVIKDRAIDSLAFQVN